MRGIIGHGGYLPRRRLDRLSIAAVMASSPVPGHRSVASFDEDTTTMGLEAARLALHNSGPSRPNSLWFCTSTPAYSEKTNALAIHAALQLDPNVRTADACGAPRAAMAMFCDVVEAAGTVQVVAADIRVGLAGSAEEAQGGDGAASVVVGDGDDTTLQASYLGGASLNREFLDRWRDPQSRFTKAWEERHSEARYRELIPEAWARALKAASLETGDVDALLVAGPSRRTNRSAATWIGVALDPIVEEFDRSIGWTGAAHPFVLLCSYLEEAPAGRTLGLVSVSEGVDVVLLRTTGGGNRQPAGATIRDQERLGLPIAYGKFLAWRGLLDADRPRRPQPGRVSAPAATRGAAWKFGFIGSRDTRTGELRLPPAIPGADPDAILEPAPTAGALGTVVTYTVDRLAYSPSPPIVFAVVDFDGGGRLPVELTDVEVETVKVGMRVEMTFRRLGVTDEIVNYFWKARPATGLA